MRRLFLKTLFLTASVVLIVSCKDDEKPKGGSFTYNGEKIVLKKAFSSQSGLETDGTDTYYNWGLVITTDGLDYDSDEDDFTGSGDLVYFNLWGFNVGENDFPTGTFKYDYGDGESVAAEAGIYLGYVAATDDAESSIENISDVTVTITKSGSSYKVTFSITLDTEEVISGTYNGVITPADF